ncbi:MAG: hypothetical protein JST83_00175 [Bacteroidetes bacterium]|nr:hypothetical protein [Bacteroidota bacterium]
MFLVIAVIGLTACDPIKLVEFKNRTGSPVNVKIVQGGTDIYRFHNNLTQYKYLDTIRFQLLPDSSTGFSFGLGSISEYELERLAHSIKFIEIGTPTATKVYKDSTQVLNLFKANLKRNFMHQRVEVDFE